MVETPTAQVQTTATDMRAATEAVEVTREILTRLFGGADLQGVAFRLWDGTTWPNSAPADPTTTITLNHPGALRAMLLPPSDLALGEAFIHGLFDITGDIETAFRLYDAIGADALSPRKLLPLVSLLRRLPEAPNEDANRAANPRGWRHSRRRDRDAIRYHYDVSNAFYALWLDRRMVYSCAYFPTATEDLDAAQEAKLDLLCRKLRLKPGERLLDIGSGWGGLVQFAAERYGVDATGVTLSEQQALLARERLAAAGLDERARIILADYRDLPTSAPFDKIVSVGMFEHVGFTHLPEYFRTAHRLLKPGGLFLNHGIAEQHTFPSRPRRVLDRIAGERLSFVQRYVFPDGDLMPVSTSLGIAEQAGWEVRDVESLREHYARTLRFWVSRLEAHEEEAIALVGPVAYRIWRIYMAGSAYNFAHEHLSIFQALLAKPDAGGHVAIPPSRADIYHGVG